jgi:hypothetical protein
LQIPPMAITPLLLWYDIFASIADYRADKKQVRRSGTDRSGTDTVFP